MVLDVAANRASGLVSMSDKEFKRLSDFIHTEVGIKLPLSKKVMVEARLQKRLRLLGKNGYRDYFEFLFSAEGLDEELVHLIDVITTNTTEFFREPRHFEIMTEQTLPMWRSQHGTGRPFRLWSAGCSTGEEPYTLCIVLSEFASRFAGFRFNVMATDISTRVLAMAQSGIYPEERLAKMSLELKRRYFLRSKDKAKRLVRVAPELRRIVDYRRLNFMDSFALPELLDTIFCRNVMIYFDRATQERLLQKFCTQLLPGGFLFIGHSESLTGMDLPLRQHAPTVYRKI
ncbi:MAG: methylase of chemotaxis methyl-accepting protein [Solidesulfovibrio magneticus str. Maddingley MBC34]|uniref:protein-glutamate O-methyltransferase n=1 Tax=Solidesulfovibrio magneticus str. Maddingley MBC34 TaxID=1206767 RepID=K6FH18_9BACT|nr:MAG: methylase of chemotaxis methyl-accepting protein [Solidesulfovibrio magneticus str. Maddingley MBC34]